MRKLIHLPVIGLLLFSLLTSSGAQAPEQVGPDANGGTLLPTRQRVRPAGRSLEFGGRPVDMALSPNGQTLYLKDNRGVVAVDTANWKVLQELKLEGGTSMHGIAVSTDGSHLYVTDAQSELAEAAIGPDGTLAWKRRIPLPGSVSGASYPCGIALQPDGKRALVCLSRSNSLGIVDLSEGKLLSAVPVGVAPWSVVLSADGRTAFVSDWGGRRAGKGERTAPSAGTPTLVDRRGIASSGCVSLVDLDKGSEIAQIDTGLHPSDLKLSADGRRLYVANANSDTVSAIDVAARKVIETISVRPDPSLPFGSAPNGLALSGDGKILYVANGGNNAVAVIELGDAPRSRSRIRGLIPAGWYPGSLLIDHDDLYIANVKGLGSRGAKEQGKEWNVYDFLGSVQQAPFPGETQLHAYTAQARADARIPQTLQAYERALSRERPKPIPDHVGAPSVFEHVIYILKENRTYDQLFGDMKQGNGDAAICTFGHDVTPNHHALAEQFVLLDNFYCNGTLSADGHSWATEGNVTDHLEKAFGGFTRSYTFGDDPLTYSSSGFLWDNALAHGLSFRNYGEMDYAGTVPLSDFSAVYRDYFGGPHKIQFSQSIGIDNLHRYSSPNYPGWNLSIPDLVRADRFLKELKEYEKSGGFPNLVLIYLPNDHTGGDISARSYLADNDLALGRVIEGISHSRFWPKTCIFVMEDDPQSGWDHVDGHRSPCLVVSPYTKRNTVIHRFYNQTSVLHTMEQILCLPPMNQMDSAAPIMSACFTSKPVLQPYKALANRVSIPETKSALNRLRRKFAVWRTLSRKVRFDHPDASDDDAFNRLLWREVKGDRVPYPARLAGRDD